MGPSPAVLGSLPGLLLLLLGPRPSSSDGNVGCLFSPSLCAPNIEWCYNDDAFGRCLQENVDEEDLYRHDLSPDELQEIEREMERLLSRGYRWSHSYTQCLLQSMLYTYKINAVNEPDLCDHLKDQDLSTALKAFESDEMSMDPQNMAYVKFTPSDNGPNAEFADEVYFPLVPLDSDVTPVREQIDDTYEDDEVDVPQAFEDDSDYPSIGFSQKQFPFSLVRKKSLPEQQSVHFSTKYNTIDDFRRGFELKDVLPDLINEGFYYPDGFSVAKEMGIEGAPNKMEQTQQLVIPVEDSGDVDSSNSILLPMLRAIGESYPSPRAEPRMAPESARELLAELSNRGRQAEGEMARGYTEGGLVLIPDKHADADQSLRDFLDISWGFKRPERLDVKKPGPPFKTNNYAFKAPDEERSHKNKTENNMKETILSNGKQLDVNSKSSYQLFGSDLPIPLKAIMAEQLGVEVPPQKKAVGPNEIDMAGSEQYDIVNNNFAFINFKETIGTWQQGKHIIEKVAELLHLDKAAFDEIRIDRNEVTFRVRPNHRGLTAIKVAELIGNMKTTSKKRLGVTIISAGIGDKTKVVPEVLSVGGGVGGEREHELVVVAVVVSVVLVAVALSATLLLLVRRYSAGRAKIRDLAAPDTEASNDYQELCRARMAAKPPHDAAAASVPNRVASLSRESDNSPSSRSSTSSWSEEPALTTMDISTGHMVLSYMEDHLRNKDRLETEWAALCAYEAEPCSTTIATRPENAKKNRYAHALPYDHARVVLNELSNISGSDYINASTITDHDPRNPAYIATQGALPHTAADLWQMVWEQGCVVMVMLTRLADNDTALCHRYWPEEGSELYHIYEVHLVSEHFWCDDYLVRSFYLKNLKTTETRTVTQFHFLSWPDGGVPASTKALLEFRRKVNKSFRGRSCPIVVHCSDGVGRTGTYCLLDMVLNRMAKGAKEIDIAATLEHIRDQRGGSVATRQQFQFVLSAVAEEVQAILRVLPPATAQLKPSAVAAAVAATDTAVAATDTAAPQ